MILKGSTSRSVKKQNIRQKKLTCKNMEEKCPLCLDIFDLDEVNFFPCQCGYKICRFCWHRIRTIENGLCPHCRRQYPEDPVTFKPLSAEESAKLKNEKKKKEMQKKKEVAESRKQLGNVRVVQKNLVFVHGLPLGIDTQEEKYNQLYQIFKDCGPLIKCVVNNKTAYAGSQIPKASVYITYQKIEDALKAYKSLPSKIVEYDVKTSLGTTKYCSNFLKNVHCPKQDCMYLHEFAEDGLCFTKDQIHAGDHLEFGNQLYEKMVSVPHTKSSQNNQSKDPLISEQEVEVEPKQKIVELNDDISNQKSESSNSSRQNNTSPQKSKLQQLFDTREPENEVLESELLKERFRNPVSYEKLLNRFIGTRTNGESSVQKSLSEETTVSNTAKTQKVNNTVKTQKVNSTVKKSDITKITYPESQDVPRNDLWQRKSSVEQSNGLHGHQNANNIPNDYNILNGIDSASHILNSLSLNHSENGISNSIIYPRSESPVRLDDELGFDPVTVSINGLQDLIKSQPVAQKSVNIAQLQQQQQHLLHQQHLLQQQQLQQRMQYRVPASQAARVRYQNHTQRQKNPPPGFALNNLQPSEPQPSPAYDIRNNVLIQRMSPNGPSAMNVPNTYNPVRNYQVPRYPQGGVSLNSNAIMNGYSTPIRNLTSHNPLQAQAMQEMLSRSIPAVQQIQTQVQNIPHTQYAHPEPSLPSPSYWNVNQPQQWMQAENSFQGQTMQDFGPASPMLHRRMQPQPRPVDYNRQIQQVAVQFNNPSPFPDNSQYIYSNAQHNQPHKEVLYP